MTTMTSGQWVLPIDGSILPDRALIGGKAWSVAHMRSLGLPVPPAFVITTSACHAYQASGTVPDELMSEVRNGMQWLEAQTGRRFGAGDAPLLVSVRSGAPVSMPGMMDTVLNLGMNVQSAAALAAESRDPRFARDTLRRFHEMYADIVLGSQLPALSEAQDIPAMSAAIAMHSGNSFPEDPMDQLEQAVTAVFDSWNSRRARRYRKHHDISDSLGTAVIVQSMIFGNLDENSGTGVLFTRNPLTGERHPYGEYLRQAQGEDVVSGKFTPGSLADMKQLVPDAYDQLLAAGAILEREHAEVQDIEFTVQQGTLYLLQSRTAKRAPAAAARIAVDMHREGAVTMEQAIARITPAQIRSVLSPRLQPGQALDKATLFSGLGVSPGIGIGRVATDADSAEQLARQGEQVILATSTTSPDDVHGMLVCNAVITESGGSTSHAAVVGRALGLPCVVGCGPGTVTTLAGQTVTVDGEHGRIYAGQLAVEIPCETQDDRLAELREWAAKLSPIRVLRREEAPASTLDLDAFEEAVEPDKLAGLLAGARGAKGGAIASDEGVRAALAAGLEYIVAEPSLPPLIAAIHARAGRIPSDNQ
ncbi:MAG: pyruvate, phosphate dikinase [Halieaceae bacterium]|jgi:pyruvate,orthophosphate dikinase|nr:pyruvate, phosphate dikinase [Halieaceae bacterium]